LTAEASELTSVRDKNTLLTTLVTVADKTRRPLYHLQAEELGTDASSLGTKLAEVLKLAAEWNAIILLDGQCCFPCCK
jgi:hypothetical protein